MFKILCAVGIVFLLVDVGMSEDTPLQRCKLQAVYFDGGHKVGVAPDEAACMAYNSLELNCGWLVQEGHLFVKALLDKFKGYAINCSGDTKVCKEVADDLDKTWENATADTATNETCQQYYDFMYHCGYEQVVEEFVKKYAMFEMYCVTTKQTCRNMTEMAEELGDSNFTVEACEVFYPWAKSCYYDAYALPVVQKYVLFIQRCMYTYPLGLCRNLSDALTSVKLSYDSLDVKPEDCKAYYDFKFNCDNRVNYSYEGLRIADTLEVFDILCSAEENERKEKCHKKAEKFEIDMGPKDQRGGYPMSIFCMKYDTLLKKCSNLKPGDALVNSFLEDHQEKHDKCKNVTYTTSCPGMAETLTYEVNNQIHGKEGVTVRHCQQYNILKDVCSQANDADTLKALTNEFEGQCVGKILDYQCNETATQLKEVKPDKGEADPVICGKYSVAKTICAEVVATKPIFESLKFLDETCSVRSARNIDPEPKPATNPVDPEPKPATPPSTPVPDQSSESTTEATSAKTDPSPPTKASESTSTTNGNTTPANATSTPNGNDTTVKPSANAHPTTPQNPSHNATDNSAMNQFASGFPMVHFCSFAIGVYAFAFFGHR